mmetsp:Transcript_13680/g.33672  ORF Transcript_13680/g.33672 Transcript_13680/m.33672 type:complete len:255 (-) Transcript_13680:3013-3777(-)
MTSHLYARHMIHHTCEVATMSSQNATTTPISGMTTSGCAPSTLDSNPAPDVAVPSVAPVWNRLLPELGGDMYCSRYHRATVAGSSAPQESSSVRMDTMMPPSAPMWRSGMKCRLRSDLRTSDTSSVDVPEGSSLTPSSRLSTTMARSPTSQFLPMRTRLSHITPITSSWPGGAMTEVCSLALLWMIELSPISIRSWPSTMMASMMTFLPIFMPSRRYSQLITGVRTSQGAMMVMTWLMVDLTHAQAMKWAPRSA